MPLVPATEGISEVPRGRSGTGSLCGSTLSPKDDGSDGVALALAFAAIVLRKPSQPKRGRSRPSLVPRVDPPEPP